MLIEECFEYNQHFVAMMNVINLAKKTNIEGKFERHHIIPRCFYKAKGLEIDNSESNLVNLTYEQHRKVHELAVLCAVPNMINSLQYAANLMNGTNNHRLGGHRTKETRAKISVSLTGKKRSDETRAKISASEKGKKVNEETLAKISTAKKGKPSWNSGKTNVYSDETRAKMSANAASKRSEVRAKLSAARKGKHWHLENGKRVWSE